MKLKAAMRHFLRQPWLFTAMVGLCGGIAMLALYVVQPVALQRLDLRIYDALLPLRRLSQPSAVPVVIDIDEESLARHGQWPWPRYLVADLVDRLASRGVASIGLDIMFAEPDRTSPARMREGLYRDRGISLEIAGLPAFLADFDTLFAASVRAAPVVLGAFARYSGEQYHGPTPQPPAMIARGGKDAPPYDSFLPFAPGAVLPLPQFFEDAPVGFVNVSPDADGLVRQIPLLIRFGDAVYPSLALQALMRALGTDALRLYTGPDGLFSVAAGDFKIPVSREGYMLVPFQGGRRTYRYISAARVLDGTATQADLEGCIAFVGTSAPGLADIRATPFDRVMPGVEVHAAAIDAMVNGNFVQSPSWAPGAQALIIAFMTCAATLAFGFAGPRVYVPSSIGLMGATVLASRQLFMSGLFLSPLYGLLTSLLCGGLLLSVRFWHEEKQKIVLRRAFSRYVSPEVVRQISKRQGDLLAGENRELSILFTDIRGFTSLSESLSPQDVVQLLNRYFTPMTAIVRSRSGTLDKFIGDALMAFWNAPLDVPGHPALAVDAALCMQEQLETLNSEIEASFGIRLAMGAGIHTGQAYVGNMGSDDLINYTLIGDNVNLASRLEGLCKRYGVPVVVSEHTMQGCGDAFSFVHLDVLRVKGKTRPVSIYWPMRPGTDEIFQQAMPQWSLARSQYEQGDFAGAAASFAVLAAAYPAVRLFGLYHERSLTLVQTPPADWEGIWTMEGK